MNATDRIRALYATLPESHAHFRDRLGRPLTLTEKVLYSHLADPEQDLERGVSYGDFNVDRVAMQDATAQMAMLQFMVAGRERVAVPATIHCDHLIRAETGAVADLKRSIGENAEVFSFLESVSRRYGIGFWKPGAGIIHQVVLENYAFPGGMMIGTDSHTPNAGGMGMVAVGVGGADAVDALVGLSWNVRLPKVIGVHLTGAPSGWTAPKDVILKLAGILTVKGGTGAIVEYFGEGTRALSATGKGTITNMGAEIGATTSIFPYDDGMARYLRATGRDDVAELTEAHAEFLVADPEVAADPERFYDRIVEIDLTTLEPHLVGPHTPDLARPVSAMEAEAQEKGYPMEISQALIGSCTNSSYEDMDRVASLARQAADAGLELKTPLLVTPGSESVHLTIKRDGQMAVLENAGATVLANACGPCIGQWKRGDIESGETNTIVTSYNRNFRRRNDGNAETLAFIGSPDVVIALAYAGTLGFNPMSDSLPTPDGGTFKFDPPKGRELPDGFEPDPAGFVPAPEDGSDVDVVIAPDSDRIQRLEPFAAAPAGDFEDLLVLLKALGKCTTDHISAAGPWLRFRGHLDNITDNLFMGATNAFTNEVGKGTDILSGEKGVKLSDLGRRYKAVDRRWIVVGDENYGEGSSREHAAMEPRFLGAAAVIVRSFARIHETNLKKQGVLGLTFVDPADYDKIRETDRIDLRGLADLAPGSRVTVVVRHEDSTVEQFETKHTMNETQIEWYRAGSALNWIRARNADTDS